MNTTSLAEANAAFEKKHFALATEVYESIIAANPDHALGHEGLAKCHFASQRWEKAAQEAVAALRLDAALVVPHRILANCYLRQERLDSYERELRIVIDKDPTAWEVRLALGDLLVSTGGQAEGIRWFQQAAEAAPGEWLPYYHLAGVFVRSNDRRRTWAALKAAFERRRSFLTAFFFVSAYLSLNRAWMLPVTVLTVLASLILPSPLLLPVALLIAAVLLWGATSYVMLGDRRMATLSVVAITLYIGLLLVVRLP